MSEKSCATCICRHVARNDLECRFMPPTQDVGRYAVYPKVKPNDYCHAGYRPDGPTALAEHLSDVAAPHDGDVANPPAGDLLADLEAPREIAPGAAKRARRAQSDA